MLDQLRELRTDEGFPCAGRPATVFEKRLLRLSEIGLGLVRRLLLAVQTKAAQRSAPPTNSACRRKNLNQRSKSPANLRGASTRAPARSHKLRLQKVDSCWMHCLAYESPSRFAPRKKPRRIFSHRVRGIRCSGRWEWFWKQHPNRGGKEGRESPPSDNAGPRRCRAAHPRR